jgi:hypothetical protein
MTNEIEMNTEEQVMDAVLLLYPEWTSALQGAEDRVRADMATAAASGYQSREMARTHELQGVRRDRLAMARKALVRMATLIGERRQADRAPKPAAPEALSLGEINNMLLLATQLRTSAAGPLGATAKNDTVGLRQMLRAASDTLSDIAARRLPVPAKALPALPSHLLLPDDDDVGELQGAMHGDGVIPDQWSTSRDLQAALIAINNALAAARAAGVNVTVGVDLASTPSFCVSAEISL